jgi:hypothetical protein
MDLERIYNWSIGNKLAINPGKSHAMLTNLNLLPVLFGSNQKAFFSKKSRTLESSFDVE